MGQMTIVNPLHNVRIVQWATVCYSQHMNQILLTCSLIFTQFMLFLILSIFSMILILDSYSSEYHSQMLTGINNLISAMNKSTWTASLTLIFLFFTRAQRFLRNRTILYRYHDLFIYALWHFVTFVTFLWTFCRKILSMCKVRYKCHLAL